MPAKKKTKKTIKKKVRVPAKKIPKAKLTKPVKNKSVASYEPRSNRISIVLKNLVLFGVLFILSVAIGWVSANKIVDEVFYILAILTGFVAVAFIILLLILFFMRQIRK